MSDERETLELDVVFVGAGPASLAGAYHLARLAKQNGLELSIGVLEKGREITSHAISGAVVDPRALKELFPDDWQSAPFEGEIEGEKVLWMTEQGALSIPIPPPMNNHGNYVASLGKLLKWMAPKVEAAGVDIFFEFPAVQALVEDGRVVGVRTGDKGISRARARRRPTTSRGSTSAPRSRCSARGCAAPWSSSSPSRSSLWEGKNPQIYAIGLKEVWDLPAGRVEPAR